MKWVIMLGNKYVTPPGSERSYTLYLERARLFDTVEAAERERCGNERVVEVSNWR